MAIREVLTSFTFEQQRLMINLIGTDVGDTSTLLTPTNVVVPAINEIVNGDVDLINQTHGMDPGSLASPSLYWGTNQGFFLVDANKIGLSTGLAIAGNLEVDGDITFRAGAGAGDGAHRSPQLAGAHVPERSGRHRGRVRQDLPAGGLLRLFQGCLLQRSPRRRRRARWWRRDRRRPRR